MSGVRGIRGLCWSVVVSVFALGACGGDREPQPSSSSSAANAARATLPAQAVALTQGSALAASAGGFSNQPKQGRATLSAIAPPRADGATKLTANGIHLELRSEGAAERQAELEDGKVIYRDAFPDTDVVIAAQGARFEELRVLALSEGPRDGALPAEGHGDVAPREGQR